MKFEELKESKPLSEIDYFDLLTCDEWKFRREEILKRDNYKCTKCNKTKTISGNFQGKSIHYHLIENVIYQSETYISLHVHHMLYIYNRLPWDYKDKYLVTLCNICHKNFHYENNVEVWDEHELNKMEIGFCERCSGDGYIEAYRKIQNGICFKCRGYGYDRKLINVEEL